MPQALIVGAYGQDNPGDEALLRATITAVRAAPGWEPLVATAQPVDTERDLGVDTVPADPATTARAATRADALVVGGGTVFKELHPASGRPPGSLLRRAAMLTASMRARQRPVALIGVGAAPIQRRANRVVARSLASRSDLLVLRDEESAEVLVAAGCPAPLRVGADLAWLTLTPRPPGASNGSSPPGRRGDGVGIAVSHLAGDADLARRIAHAVAASCGDDQRVDVEPWQGSPRLGADARLASELARAHGPAEVSAPPRDLSDAVERCRRRSLVVAMRFHAAVAAAAAGTPFVAVAHEPKLAAIARRTGQQAVAPDASPDAMAAAIAAAVAGPPPDAEAIARERLRAAATADILGLLLSGVGATDDLASLELVPEPRAA